MTGPDPPQATGPQPLWPAGQEFTPWAPAPPPQASPPVVARVVEKDGPRSRGRLALGCLAVVLVVIVVGIALAVVLARSSFGRGFGAALAIAERGAPEVTTAFYTQTPGSGAVMDVYLAAGVDPSRGRAIGCGIVVEELHRANLDGTDWVVFDADRQPVADSSTPCP